MSYASVILIVSLFCLLHISSRRKKNHGLFELGSRVLSARAQQERDHARRCSWAKSLEEIPVFGLKTNTALHMVPLVTSKTFEVPKEAFCLVVKVRDLNSACLWLIIMISNYFLNSLHLSYCGFSAHICFIKKKWLCKNNRALCCRRARRQGGTQEQRLFLVG